MNTCRSIGDACVPLWTALRMGFAIMTASIASLRSLYLARAVRRAFCAAVRSPSSFTPEEPDEQKNKNKTMIIFATTTRLACDILTDLLRVDDGDLEPQLLQPVVQLQHLRLIFGEGQTRFTAVDAGHGFVGLTHIVCWRVELAAQRGLLICRIG